MYLIINSSNSNNRSSLGSLHYSALDDKLGILLNMNLGFEVLRESQLSILVRSRTLGLVTKRIEQLTQHHQALLEILTFGHGLLGVADTDGLFSNRCLV